MALRTKAELLGDERTASILKANPDMSPISAEVVPAEVIYKVLLYIKIHDNSTAQKIRLKGIELLKHCAPQYIQTIKSKDGVSTDHYRNAAAAKNFLKLVALAINELCREILNEVIDENKPNLITGIETVPSGDILIYYGNRRATK